MLSNPGQQLRDAFPRAIKAQDDPAEAAAIARENAHQEQAKDLQLSLYRRGRDIELDVRAALAAAQEGVIKPQENVSPVVIPADTLLSAKDIKRVIEESTIHYQAKEANVYLDIQVETQNGVTTISFDVDFQRPYQGRKVAIAAPASKKKKLFGIFG